MNESYAMYCEAIQYATTAQMANILLDMSISKVSKNIKEL
jgi:hypothetical protein